MAKWTCVEDGLPEHDTDCWLNIPSEWPESAKLGHFFLDSDICADGLWSWGLEHSCVCAKTVTHWMPYYTPELPQS